MFDLSKIKIFVKYVLYILYLLLIENNNIVPLDYIQNSFIREIYEGSYK